MPTFVRFPNLGAAFTLAACMFAAPGSLAGPPAPTDVLNLGPVVDLTPPTYGNTQRLDSAPAIATNGTDALSCWLDAPSTSSGASIVACARLAANSTVIDVPPVALSITGNPTVIWDGTQYVVVAGGRAQTVDPGAGAIGSPYTFDLPPSASVAAGGGVILATWVDPAGAAGVDEIRNRERVTVPSARSCPRRWHDGVPSWAAGRALRLRQLAVKVRRDAPRATPRTPSRTCRAARHSKK